MTLPILNHVERDPDNAIQLRRPPESAIDEDGSYSPDDARPDDDLVTEVIETAIEEDAVIDFAHRLGGRPYFKFTPYWNHRDAKNPMWSCMTFTMKPMPGRAILGYPHIIEPSRDRDSVRYFSTAWMWRTTRMEDSIYLRTVDASPFTGTLFKWKPDPRSGEGD